jgi:hypothetical protein
MAVDGVVAVAEMVVVGKGVRVTAVSGSGPQAARATRVNNKHMIRFILFSFCQK